MEIELKYLADKEAFENILADEEIKGMLVDETYEVFQMRATYFDTEDKNLRQHRIAVRARHENDEVVATVKWGGGTREGLHVRGEYNVVVDEKFAENPDIKALKDCEVYEQIVDIMEGKELKPIVGTYFMRTQVHIDTGKSVSVISYDDGMIRAAGRIAPISEIELEFISGDTDDMLKLGEKLAGRFGLQPEDKSKFRRGLELHIK